MSNELFDRLDALMESSPYPEHGAKTLHWTDRFNEATVWVYAAPVVSRLEDDETVDEAVAALDRVNEVRGRT